MDSRSNLRQNSLHALKTRSESSDYSPYLIPVKSNCTLVLKRPKIINRRKRISTAISTKTPLVSNTEELENLRQNSKSLNDISSVLSNTSFDSQESTISYHTADIINQKLQDKLNDISNNDYKSKFNAYFAVFDLIIIADKPFSKLLSTVKDGFISCLDSIHASKTLLLNNQIIQFKETIEALKADKQTLINKLNTLSSENINLITANESLSENCLNLERTIKFSSEKKNSNLSYIEELQKKGDRIKDLSVKLEEMYRNEAKLLMIFDNLKNQGINFEKVYEDA